MSAELAAVESPPQSQRAERYRIQVQDPVAVLDTGRFEQMQRIATVMARSNLIPETLCATYEGTGASRVTTWLPMETVIANCFLIVNQAVRWNMDPFAVAQCASVVHGRVCYEGKLIAAVLDAKIGLRLVPEYSDVGKGDSARVTIYAYDTADKPAVNPRTGEPLTIDGTVGDWKTTGANSAWGNVKNHPRMLMYRGSREWARIHRPAVMLGVYSDDEMESISERQERRAPAPPILIRDDPPKAPAIEHKLAVPMDTAAAKSPMQEIADDMRAGTATFVSPASGAAATVTSGPRRAPPPPAAKPVEQPKPVEPPAVDYIDATEALAEFEEAAEICRDENGLNECYDDFCGPLTGSDKERADKIYQRNLRRITG